MYFQITFKSIQKSDPYLHYTKEFIDNNCPAYQINWPSKGADMNPIENAWAELQKSVSHKIREDGRPDSREELWHYVGSSWEELRETDIVENLYRSMPNRMRSVIESHGNWTKY